MEDGLIKKTAILSFLTMLFVAGLSAIISHYGENNLKAGGKIAGIFSLYKQWNKNFLKDNVKLNDLSEEVKKRLGDKYLVIQKPEEGFLEVELNELYMQKNLILTVKNLNTKGINETSIFRENGGYRLNGTLYKNNMVNVIEEQKVQAVNGVPNNQITNKEILLVPEVIAANGDKYSYEGFSENYITDPLSEIAIDYIVSKEGTYTATIKLRLDYIYAPILYEDKKNIYIGLKRPKEVYDTIVVIDAGHGGKDAGAYSKDEKYYEKDINLSIMKHLENLLKKQNIKVYYTRTKDETVYLNPRVNLANEVEADLFLSIHCNSSESEIPSGSEVLYNEKQGREGFNSKEFANLVLDEIVGLTGKINRGLVPASEMVVVGKSEVPIALVETAFISNKKELQLLTDEMKQIQIAEALNRAIGRALKELKK